jgi:type II secretory pathway predicted ATPase ExeA
MFLDFYKLKEQPFGVTPDPHFLYLSGSHREALASLFYGVETGRGLLALVAPPGMGKTTLLFRLLQYLRRSARTAFLFQTQCDSLGLMRYLMNDLGIDTRGQDFVTMHEQLNHLLIREANSGKRFVLVIDEAQNLNDSVLETARLLSDFETPSKKLLQIVFAGQPRLAEKLQRPELAQLRQRISILGRLEPLSASEVNHYIDHRLRVAGHNSGSLFTSAACERVAASSRGIPRNINMLCFNALSLGCVLGRRQVDADVVREAEADLELRSLADERWREPPEIGAPVSASLEAKTCIRLQASSPPYFSNTPTERLMKWNDDLTKTDSRSQPIDAWCNELKTAVTSILKSLEPARTQNSEIPTEIVVDEARAKPDFVHPPDCNDAFRLQIIDCEGIELELEGTHFVVHQTFNSSADLAETIEPQSLVDGLRGESPTSLTKPITGRKTTSRLPVFQLCEKDHTISRLALFAAVLVLALFGISLLHFAGKAEMVTPSTATEQGPKSRSSEAELGDRSDAVTESELTTVNSMVATSVAMPLNSAPERQTEQTFTRSAYANAQSARGATAVIVQPNDDLRQICVRYLGRYDAEVLREITEFNSELSDPDRIVVGQRIVLPTLAPAKGAASRVSRLPKQ